MPGKFYNGSSKRKLTSGEYRSSGLRRMAVGEGQTVARIWRARKSTPFFSLMPGALPESKRENRQFMTSF